MANLLFCAKPDAGYEKRKIGAAVPISLRSIRATELLLLHFRLQFIEMLKKSPLGRIGGPWRQIIRFDRGRQGRAGAEESPRLRGAEARECRRLQESGATIGRLDDG